MSATNTATLLGDVTAPLPTLAIALSDSPAAEASS